MMNQYQIASFYRQTSTRGSNPVGLVVKLYDAILEDFRLALEALDAGNIERRTGAMNHALQVIAELENSLDHQRGGEVARHLQGLYRVTRAMILEANIRASREQIEKLAQLYRPVRQAWQQAEQVSAQHNTEVQARTHVQAPQSLSPAPETQREGVAMNAEPDADRSHWNA